MSQPEALLGIDVGSTTVKCVVVDPTTLTPRFARYRRHETRQAECLRELLAEAEAECPGLAAGGALVHATGSGAGPLAAALGVRCLQEVNAVTLAVERLHPEVESVIELGGQDAKVILFLAAPGREGRDGGEGRAGSEGQAGQAGGGRRVFTSMNDKCASGTGATIDKCLLKLGLAPAEIAALTFDPSQLHPVAAKCGVFAETDIVNLMKAGVPAAEILLSLADAICLQNLSVLVRGHTPRPRVLLLGGPNTYLPFLVACWRQRIADLWAERGLVPPDLPLDQLIFVPPHAEYYAALGATLYGLAEEEAEATTAATTAAPATATATSSRYRGLGGLDALLHGGARAVQGNRVGPGLAVDAAAREAFLARYHRPPFAPAPLAVGTAVPVYIGLDGGSTTSKAVLLDAEGTLLAKEYLLSQGNPIADARLLLTRLHDYAAGQGARLEVLGMGVTGYAGDVLTAALRCDANTVETVAHAKSALHCCGPDVDVICDIGGQDIKVLFLRQGEIHNFRLSNQCSAGNGMLLQAMAHQFGVALPDYAEVAFRATRAPEFSYGCAVFLDTDRVNFQKDGYTREELFAGLARVLPKNVWQYVVQIPRLAALGRRFVLQGGTQYNLAAVKAQVDYIEARVPGAEVQVHPHAGECGAIGAALEAMAAVARRGGRSTFIGLPAALALSYSTRTDEGTRCHFCDNHCARTFVDIALPDGGQTRYIAGFSCEKGTVESTAAVQTLVRERRRLKASYPNLAEYEAHLLFRRAYLPEPLPAAGSPIAMAETRRPWWDLGWGQGWGRPPSRRRGRSRPFEGAPPEVLARRGDARVGIPRVLNLYSVAPFLRAYLETLGVAPEHIVFSPETSEDLWTEGSKYGAIDPCFPAKVALAHVHHLLLKPKGGRLDYLWFPAITHLPEVIADGAGATACPVVAGTPVVAKAAFTKERDHFAARGVVYLDGALRFNDPLLLAHQLLTTWGAALGVTADESAFACAQGWRALAACDLELERRGREVLDQVERDGRIAILLLGRPYHLDPGLHHGVLEEYQALGYPILTIRSLPKAPDYLRALFAEDLAAGTMRDAMDIRDVWPESFSANSAQRVWAAKFAARHGRIAVLDLSSFKCGHDAPTYGIVDGILAHAHTPYSALHDLDANKPGGSIQIRVRTYAHTLERYREALAATAATGTLGEGEGAAAARRRERLAGLAAHGAVAAKGANVEDAAEAGDPESPVTGGQVTGGIDAKPQSTAVGAVPATPAPAPASVPASAPATVLDAAYVAYAQREPQTAVLDAAYAEYLAEAGAEMGAEAGARVVAVDFKQPRPVAVPVRFHKRHADRHAEPPRDDEGRSAQGGG
jgi:activator of 2-hydroxyglutaryl-CoA dehydratase/predicted nucleotide-binding protein (sugar kinase/HSP70/actin superfamily)